MASLLGIAYKERRKGPMLELETATLSPEEGLQGDWRGKPGKRQVTLMSLKDWQTACSELGVELPWTIRRANLLVDELDFHYKTGHKICIGDALVLEITGETDPCSRMEDAQPGLFKTLEPDWRGGVTCRVIQGGQIKINNNVSINE
jgi:MOSC domain-containing protein YiiM